MVSPDLFLFFVVELGHVGIGEGTLAAGCDAGHTADAVGVAHELRVGYIDIHGAGAGALPAVAAFVLIAPDAEDTQHAPQPLTGSTRAEVVAEWAFDEEAYQQKAANDSRGRRQNVSMQQFAEVVRSFQQGKGYAPGGQQKVEYVAAQLQVALCPARYMQLWQV